jgi:hypothetical protein
MPAAPDAGDDALDSDFDPDTRRTVTPIEVARGQRVTGIDLGILASVDEIPVNACR